MINKPGAVETRRLFFALWPEPVLQQYLEKVAVAVLAEHSGKPVRPENLHCTLVFLGNTDPSQRLCVEAAATHAASMCVPFSLTLDRVGFFRRPQVLWLGCRDVPAPLRQLVELLQAGCTSCGYPPEARPYEVHVTVARKVRRDPGRLPFMPLEWAVNRFALVESRSGPDGVRYEPVRFWDLAAK